MSFVTDIHLESLTSAYEPSGFYLCHLNELSGTLKTKLVYKRKRAAGIPPGFFVFPTIVTHTASTVNRSLMGESAGELASMITEVPARQ